MRINPTIASSAIHRYEKVVHRETAAAEGLSTADRVELSDKARLYSSLIQSARSSGDDIREDRVHAIINQIASGSYRIDVDRLAARMTGSLAGGEDDA